MLLWSQGANSFTISQNLGEKYMLLDNDVIFDKSTGRYYLTKDYVTNEMGTDLNIVLEDELDTNVSTLAERNIRYSADILYGYIQNNAFDAESTFYDFTQDKKSFNALKRALQYQLFDFLQRGDISYETGNNVRNTVNERAIQELHGANCFHIVYERVPDIEEW